MNIKRMLPIMELNNLFGSYSKMTFTEKLKEASHWSSI